MQEFLHVRNYRILNPKEVTLDLTLLKNIQLKNTTKLQDSHLQDYTLLDYPIATLLDGFVIVHVFENNITKQQGLFLIAKEMSFILSKPDLTQLMIIGTKIAHTIAIVTCLSKQTAALRGCFLRQKNKGEILRLNEVLTPKMRGKHVPSYIVLSKEKIDQLIHESQITKKNLPEMSYTQDGIARYLGFFPGMIVLNVDCGLPRLVVM